MRKTKLIVGLTTLIVIALAAADRVSRYVWTKRVFETYYELRDQRRAPLKTAPTNIIVREDGAIVVVFEPPLFFWSAHITSRAMLENTYAIEIVSDRVNNAPRIRMLQEFD